MHLPRIFHFLIIIFALLLEWTHFSEAETNISQPVYPIEGNYNSQETHKGDALRFTFPEGYQLHKLYLPPGTQLTATTVSVKAASRFRHGKIVATLESAFIPGKTDTPLYFCHGKHPQLILMSPATVLDMRASNHQYLALLADLAVLPISLHGLRAYLIPAGTEAVTGAALEVIEPTTATPHNIFTRACYGIYQEVLPIDPLYRFFKNKQSTTVTPENAVIYKIRKPSFLMKLEKTF